jgi:hypothetical protein
MMAVIDHAKDISEKPKCFHFGNWAVMFAKKDRFFELLDEQNAVLSDSE